MFLAAVVLMLLSIVVAIFYYQQITEKTSLATQINQLQSIAITRARNHTQPKIDRFDIFNDLLMSELIKIDTLHIVNLRDDPQIPKTEATLFSTIQNIDKQLQINVQLITSVSQQVLWAKTYNGQYYKALEMHQTAFSLAPLSPGIIRSLAYSHLNLRQMAQARKLYQRALTIEPIYSHRALEELDFLPLNVARANNFLRWVKNEQHNPTILPIYQLTHVLVLLSVNKILDAEKQLSSIDSQNLNPAFRLYVQAALAAAKNDMVLAVSLLKQRLDIAPDEPRYAMPYIAALHENRQYQEAFVIFKTHFPEINQKAAINIKNYPMFVFLNNLLRKNNKKQTAITTKLSSFLIQP